jgi:hypothetical protein
MRPNPDGCRRAQTNAARSFVDCRSDAFEAETVFVKNPLTPTKAASARTSLARQELTAH